MYLTQYVWRRLKTWYNDKYHQQFSMLENMSKDIHIDYVKEKLTYIVFAQLHYSDMRNNIIRIKLQNFDNIWFKIIGKIEPEIEIYTMVDNNEVVILNKTEIHHELFYQLITQHYHKKPIVNKLQISNWKKREKNYSTLYYFVDKIQQFDIKTFTSNDRIEINIVKLKEYKNNSSIARDKILFFKALEEEQYVHLLKQYTLFFEGFNTNAPTNFFCELFEKYAVTYKHIQLLDLERKPAILKSIREYTENVFSYEKHKESYYYKDIKDKIKDKNLSTYFNFLRLSILGRFQEIPIKMIATIDDTMLDDYNKITEAIIKISHNEKLLHSNITVNDYYNTIYSQYINPENEDLNRVMYYCIRSDSTINESEHNVQQILLKLIQTKLLYIPNIEHIIKHINYFHQHNNLSKIKLRNHLENKLKEKNIKKKVDKI